MARGSKWWDDIVSSLKAAAGSPVTVAGSEIDIAVATQNQRGTMSSGDKRKLDELHISIRDFGAVCDGVANDTTAVQSAVNAAISAGTGVVYVPPGALVRLTGAITIPEAVTIKGEGGVPGGINADANNFATFLADFDSSASGVFVFNGANGGGPASGGGLEGLRIVQKHTATNGIAVLITGSSASFRPSWVKLRKLIIEESASAEWLWAIKVDGSACSGIPDLYFGEISTHTSDAAGGAMLLVAATALVYNCGLYIQGNVTVGGTSEAGRSLSCQFVNVSGVTFAQRYATDTTVIGGVWTSLTDTANTLGTSTLIPGRLVNGHSPTSANTAGFWFNPAAVGQATGSWRTSRPFVFGNARYDLQALTAAGTGTVIIAGVDTNDCVRIEPLGSYRVAIGAIASVTNAVGGDLIIARGNAIREGGGGQTAKLLSTTGTACEVAKETASCEIYGNTTKRIECNATGIGVFGVTPVARVAAYTQNSPSTASRTVAAYTADNESAAYTGAADGEAKLADLNALRVAYENLRAEVEMLRSVVNQIIDDQQSYGWFQ